MWSAKACRIVLNLDSRAERCWVDHTRDSPTGLEAGPVFALGANSDGN
jgi:hypothetical protein